MPVEVDASELFGVWRFGAGGLASFADDGRYWQDTHGSLAHDPDVVGTYELTGNELTFTWSMNAYDCPPNTTAVSLITAHEDGNITFQDVSHDCFPEAAGRVWSITRVSPDNRTVAELPESPPEGMAANMGNVRGDWHVVGTSILIELDPVVGEVEGSYWWDAEGELAWSPAESGTYLLRDGGIELTVATSDTCQPGHTLLLSDTDVYGSVDASGYFVMTANASDACGRLSGPVTLVLIGL